MRQEPGAALVTTVAGEATIGPATRYTPIRLFKPVTSINHSARCDKQHIKRCTCICSDCMASRIRLSWRYASPDIPLTTSRPKTQATVLPLTTC